MKKIFTLFFISFLTLHLTNAQELILTGVYDCDLSGGLPKGVELYVAEDIPDLSLYGIGSANNGGGTDGVEFTFPNDAVTKGTYIYVASEASVGEEVEAFLSWFGFTPDYTSDAVNINGDDAIELFKGETVIDIYGDINTDGTGTTWEYMDSWAYRKSNTGPDGSTFVEANWTIPGKSAVDGATSNAGSENPMPIKTFTMGVNNTVSSPTFDPAGGTFLEAQTVSITTTTEGASIFYTTDGSTPDEGSTLYSGAISVSETTTIKAIAMKADMDASSVASATYTIIIPVACTSISELLALENGTVATISGVVQRVFVKEAYGTVTNLGIKDTNGDTLLVYGVWNVSDEIYKVGQTLKITGKRDQYNESDQLVLATNSGHSIEITEEPSSVTPIGIASEIKMYGVNRQVRVELANVSQGSINVYDLSGKRIVTKAITSSEMNIPVSESGIYLVQVVMNNQSYTNKVWIK